MPEDFVQVNFRMPSHLKERLELAARENSRSLTSEVVYRLEASFLESGDSSPSLDRLATALENIQTMLEPIKKLSKKGKP